MLIDFVRKINAEQKFRIKDEFEFVEFSDEATSGRSGLESDESELDIIAVIKIKFDGEPPESYKVLNLIIGDWVEQHIDNLTPVIHNKLKDHFNKFYPGSDINDLDEEDTAIWTDQLDYLPSIETVDNSMLIDIELVLDCESIEE